MKASERIFRELYTCKAHKIHVYTYAFTTSVDDVMADVFILYCTSMYIYMYITLVEKHFVKAYKQT